MLNSDTKRHIDAARDVLVGVAPNPTTQIDQITYALIYKFMDDMDQASVKAGGEASFFVGDLDKYAWSNLMSTRMGNQEKMDLYSEALTKFSEAKQLPELFRTIFRAAFLPYRSPETLGLFLKEISHFDYTHPEELGNAYEYLLSIMSSQGDAGQFRTPRHIIDFIVDVINPTKDDKVLDPACGTGGFLVSTYNHILEQHDGKDDPKNKEKPLTPDERKKLMSNLQGYDIDPTMVRIAQVNMYLHQFKNPQIFQYDSLTSEERWNDKYDVILANPPFMTPKGGIKPHNKFGVASNRAEVLFVDYIINHLKPKGRAGIVVPEGVIFQSGNAYKSLRKNLVENGLFAVVSLPSGVFQPYSSVKTTILFLDNEFSAQQSEIAFVKVSADGFDLGSSKRPIEKNDLPKALEALQEWRNTGESDNSSLSFVQKSEISKTKGFKLAGGQYVEITDNSNSIWPVVALSDICTLVRGVTFSKKDEVLENGQGVLTASNLKLDGSIDFGDLKFVSGEVQFKETQKLMKDDIFICLASGSQTHIGKVAYVSSYLGLHFGGFMGSIRIQGNLINSKYLYYNLRDSKFNEYLSSAISGANIRNLSGEILGDFEISLPPIEVQEQIVLELDSYSAIVSGANQIVRNWKPKIQIEPGWEKLALGEICEINPKKSEIKNMPENNLVSFVPMSDINENNMYFEPQKDKKFSEVAGSYTYFAENDVLLAKVTPCFENGKLGIARNLINGIGFGSSEFIVLRTGSKLHPEILAAYLMEPTFRIAGKARMTGTGGLQRVPVDFVRDYSIFVPPIEEQLEIVRQIHEERNQVLAAYRLIELYEERINGTLESLRKF